MVIKVHHDKCGYWFEYISEGIKHSVSLVELIDAYEHRRIRKARWKGAGLGSYMCSWCGEEVGTKYTYCPYCGTPMAKEEEQIIQVEVENEL